MRTIAFLLTFFIATAAASCQSAEVRGNWQTYRGAWFAIDYPVNFSVTPLQKSDSGEGYDSVRFGSPDESVSLYVYAPQWSGEAPEIALNPETETLVAERSEKKGDVEVSWRTIAAKDGSYQRSYQTTVDSRGPASWTIGIGYADPGALERWREDYMTFKRSLRLYAD